MEKRFYLLLCALSFAFCVQLPVSAHELRPGYLELNETVTNTYSVVWKVPLVGGRPLSVEPVFPSICQLDGDPGSVRSDRTVIRKAIIMCEASLGGQSIELAGLGSTPTDVLVRVKSINGELQALRATPDAPAVTVAAHGEAAGVAGTYFILGVEHILFGIDHLLFVFALILIIRTPKRLVQTITAFTVAHSLTLAAATLGWANLPSRPVEAVIALSIVFLAYEIVSKEEGVVRTSERWPWLVAFLFGLLHGFGFAGALSEIGLPKGDVPLALFTFNLGVEVGQLAFLTDVFVVLLLLERLRVRKRFDKVASYVIGITASVWLFERVLS
ncbi:MAG: HupE/UreJ family protein [Gammaproteobacteria bacterium]